MRINHASRYIEERNWNKYLIFNSIDENKEVLKKYAVVWDGIKNKIKVTNFGKENNYGKDYIKIKFNSSDDLPLNKSLKFHAMTIIIRSVFEEDGKQLFLSIPFFRWHFAWIIKMLQLERIDFSEGIYVNKTSLSKECELCHYWFFKDVGFRFEEHVCNGWHDLFTMAYSLEKNSNIKRKRSYFYVLFVGY